MIVAQELRIGNWVNIEPPQDAYSGICMIEQIDRSRAFMHCETEDYFIDKRLDDINPIPLTPEILEKAGFERYESNENYYPFPESEFYALYFLNQSFKLWVNGEYNTEQEIKHLHQLQNLYYALIGEELQINL